MSQESKKPIAAIFAGFDSDIPFTRLQQLDEVGIHKVYILVSNQELMDTLTDKREIFEGSKLQTLIDYYQSYYPKDKAHIQFEIINTNNNESEEDKIRFFLKETQDNNLLQLYFCKDKNLPWLGSKLKSNINVIDITTTTYGMFNFELFKKVKHELPSLTERLSLNCADELLLTENNPTLCYPQSMFDIIHYQALFRCLIEACVVRLQQCDGDAAHDLQQRAEYLVEQYGKAIDRAKKVEEAFEQSHKEIYRNDDKPDAIQKERHNLIIEENTNAEAAFPELIRKLVDVYREICGLQFQPLMKKER